MVSPTNNGDNPYAFISILHHLTAKEFVDAWLAAPKENWRTVQYAIDNRYSEGQLRSELEVERQWAIEVHDELRDRAAKMTGLQTLRIIRIIPKALVSFAQQAAVKKTAAKKARPKAK